MTYSRQKQTVHELHREEPSDIEFDELNFDCIDTSADGTEAYASIKIKPFKNQIANLHGKIDTGSQGNVLPLCTYHKMYPDDSKHIKHSSTLLTAYNGTPIKQFGYIMLPCSYKNKSMTSNFYIAETNAPVIFGLDLCLKLGLVDLNYSIVTQRKSPIMSTKQLQEE